MRPSLRDHGGTATGWRDRRAARRAEHFQSEVTASDQSACNGARGEPQRSRDRGSTRGMTAGSAVRLMGCGKNSPERDRFEEKLCRMSPPVESRQFCGPRPQLPAVHVAGENPRPSAEIAIRSVCAISPFLGGLRFKSPQRQLARHSPLSAHGARQRSVRPICRACPFPRSADMNHLS